MKTRVFTTLGAVWLSWKVTTLLGTAITFLAATDPPGDTMNTEIQAILPSQHISVMDLPKIKSTEHDEAELPEPEPPTEDGPWSKIIST